ncbi:MAG: nuclear transport factor 2 family protein [Thermoanaerobaculia bacterium]
MKKTACALAAVLVMSAALACAKKADPVKETLDRMVKAANARDVAALFENVASDFQAADGSGRSDAETLVRRMFAAYEILNVTIHDVQVEKGENAARVRLTADLSGQPLKIGGLDGLVPRAAKYDFDLRLTSDGKSWKVAWASWQPKE